MTTNETYDLDAEILLAANPYRIPSSDDLVEAARGCNQYKHKPGCPEAGGGGENNAKKKEKQAPSRIKSDSDGGANLLILPTGDVHQVSDNDLKHYKYNTKFSAFHVNEDGTYAGTPEDGLMLGATLDEALNRFPALSEAAKKDVRSFFSANDKNGKLRFYRMKFN